MTSSGQPPRVARKLDELGFVGRGKSKHRPRNDPALYGGTHPFIQTGDVKAAELRVTKYSQTYNGAGLAQSKLWEPGTLCITIAANIAETAILGIPACFPDSIVGFVADAKRSDARFIKYYIDTIKLRMQGVSHGATQDNLSLDKLLTFDFMVPDVEEQSRIASILSAYDDLIENNNRRIKILEEMAQTLYREWFVHFRFPGHEKVKMVTSPLGKVPEGWTVGTLEDIATLQRGFDITKAEQTPGPYPVISSSGSGSTHNEFKFAGPGVIIGRKGTLGTVFYSAGPYWPHDTTLWVKDFHGFPASFVYWLLRHLQLEQYDCGASNPTINRNHVHKIALVVPPLPLAVQYGRLAQRFSDLGRCLEHRNDVLRRTRDLLLPKLISGELDVAAME